MTSESPDAVRFSARHSGNGRAGVDTNLIWILEKDNAPLKHGVVRIQPDGTLDSVFPDPILARQAEVFAESWVEAFLEQDKPRSRKTATVL